MLFHENQNFVFFIILWFFILNHSKHRCLTIPQHHRPHFFSTSTNFLDSISVTGEHRTFFSTVPVEQQLKSFVVLFFPLTLPFFLLFSFSPFRVRFPFHLLYCFYLYMRVIFAFLDHFFQEFEWKVRCIWNIFSFRT